MPHSTVASDRARTRGRSRTRVVALIGFTLLPLAAVAAKDRADVEAPEPGLVARWPALQGNQVGLDVEHLAAEIGIDLAPRFLDGHERPDPRTAEAFQSVHPALGAWLADELARDERGDGQPPGPIASFLAEHRERIERLGKRLTTGDPPTWERRPADRAGPVPNLLGHLSLQKLLLADALARARQGDAPAGLTGLEAAWRLNATLRADPMLGAWMIGVTVTRMQAGALRQVGGAGPEWAARLRALHPFAETIERLRFEGSTWSDLDDPVLLGDLGVAAEAIASLGRPATELCVADLRARWERHVDTIAEIESPCRADFEAIEAAFRDAIPWWNPLGRALPPATDTILSRVARLAVDLELTARLVEIEATRLAAGGRVLRALPPSEPSATCPGERLVIETSPNGGLTLSYDAEPTWLASEGLVLPARFTLR